MVETCTVVLTFKSVDEILWCDHSNEPLWQYFYMVLFVFHYFIKRIKIFS